MTAFDVARIGPGEGSVAPRTRLRSDAPSQSLDGPPSARGSASGSACRPRPARPASRASPTC